uniref:RNA polymerase Rpb5 N-terminal domain-containing protein n=1 Tax=Rhizophora mucronata TaxID=61149 RepID=A0A2P2QKC9_RHIMU
MLRNRGYMVADSEINMTREQFISKVGDNAKREDLVVCKHKRDNESDKLKSHPLASHVSY